MIEAYTQLSLLASIGKSMLPSLAKEEKELEVLAGVLCTLELDRDGAIVEAYVDLPGLGNAPVGAVMAGLGIGRILMTDPELIEDLDEEGAGLECDADAP